MASKRMNGMATYKEALQKADAYNAEIHSTDARLLGAVQVIHEEGTVLLFQYAFAVEWRNWYFVFAEHHGFQVYDKDDVNVIAYAGRLPIEKLKA